MRMLPGVEIHLEAAQIAGGEAARAILVRAAARGRVSSL